MKQASLSTLSVLLCLAVIPFFGCQKILEKYKPGGKEGTTVRIKTFVSQQYHNPSWSPPSLNFTVYYNAKGDPDSVVANEDNWRAFQYDANGRLTKYTYHSKDATVIRDGSHVYTYEGGRLTNDDMHEEYQSLASYGYHELYMKNSLLSYDAEGRVSYEEGDLIWYHDASPYPTYNEAKTYTYDAKGNLELYVLDSHNVPTTERITYDDKKSYLRTHPVWMFITRNYSRNNETGATKYNREGFPLAFAPTVKHGGTQTLYKGGWAIGENPLEITYETP
jgi:hypothetical protein